MKSSEYDTSTAAELGLMQGFPPPPNKRVDALNGFWVPPYNRWAYQNMRRLMPSAPLRHSSPPAPLDCIPDARIERLDVKREDGTNASFATFLQETFTDSLVVVKGDRVVHETYLNGMTAQSPHQMMSCAKSFVGLAALMAVENALVNEDDIIGDLLSDVSLGSAFAEANLGQVMDMTNSVHFSEDYADPQAHIHDYARVAGVGPGTRRSDVADSIQSYICTLETDPGIEHGAVFHYQSPKTDLLDWVVSRLTGKSYTERLEQEIWGPLGTDGEAYVLLDPAGTEIAAGGLNATPHDLARFAGMIIGRGKWNGCEIVPEMVLGKIARGGSTAAFMAGPEASGVMSDGHWSYRAQWWVRNTPGHEAISAIGVNGQWIYCDIERNVAIIKQSSLPVAVDPYFDDYTVNAFDAIIAAVSG